MSGPSTGGLRLTKDRLEAALGLGFSDPMPLSQALVHKSFINEHGGQPADSYERLEFLGDAVVELVVSTELYRRLPHLSEGELTKSRAELVCGTSLAHAARRLGLGDLLLLGRGEEANGGRQRESILADAFEAVVAAVYLDQGVERASEFVVHALAEELDSFLKQGGPRENPKSRLQEHSQSLGMPTPRYRVVFVEGPDHNPVFTVEALIGDEPWGVGKGRSRSDAERSAAEDALSRLRSRPGAVHA